MSTGSFLSLRVEENEVKPLGAVNSQARMVEQQHYLLNIPSALLQRSSHLLFTVYESIWRVHFSS